MNQLSARGPFSGSLRPYSGLVFLLFFAGPLWAQVPGSQGLKPPLVSVADTLTLDYTQDVSLQLLPFDSLYELALAHSPLLRATEANSASKLAGYQLSRYQVLDNLAPFFNYSRGNQAIIATGTDNQNIAQIANGYRFGINLQFSFYELLGRPARLRQARAEHQVARAQQDVVALDLRREMIRVYQDLLTSQRVLRVRGTDAKACQLAYRLVEISMSQGKSTPDGLAIASNRYALSQSLVEEQRGEFYKNLGHLETLVGAPVHRLKP